MNIIEQKYKEYCEEKLTLIKDFSPESLELIETMYDIRLIVISDLGTQTLFVSHSYNSMYAYILGIISGLQLEKYCTCCVGGD